MTERVAEFFGQGKKETTPYDDEDLGDQFFTGETGGKAPQHPFGRIQFDIELHSFKKQVYFLSRSPYSILNTQLSSI